MSNADIKISGLFLRTNPYMRELLLADERLENSP